MESKQTLSCLDFTGIIFLNVGSTKPVKWCAGVDPRLVRKLRMFLLKEAAELLLMVGGQNNIVTFFFFFSDTPSSYPSDAVFLFCLSAITSENVVETCFCQVEVDHVVSRSCVWCEQV